MPITRITQADHGGEHRLPDEDVGEIHPVSQRSTGWGLGSFVGWIVLLMTTGRAVQQFHLPGADDHVAFLQPGQNRDLIAARFARGHDNLLRDRVLFAVFPGAVLNHEDHVAVRIEGDRGLRQRDVTLRRRPVAISAVAYMPGSNLRCAFGKVARIATLRVAGSTLGSMVVILPVNVVPG